MHPEEPIGSPNFITKEVINDEEITKQGPNYNYEVILNDLNYEKYFAYYRSEDDHKITWIPAGKVWDQPVPKFMGMEREVWDWLFMKQGQDTLPSWARRQYSQLTDNSTLMHDGNMWKPVSDFYTIEYDPATDLISTYQIDAPGNDAYECKMAQIDDGIVMLFGGVLPGRLSNQTWIFEINKEDVVDNMGDSVKIYILDDNLYMLADEIKDAVLYNILGQKVVAVHGDRLDLTPLPLGVYFLQYTDGKGEKVAKVVRR